ncbi:MAG: iron-containing alcohol dehydrogenase [Coriobacteriaceae bacterium]|nr:iron-containing alcohol dehydrogenase [Coriobacteriaceae bacterium]MDD7584841.1 iron-containing alcohol dehydrogenase [Coriobacteriaceae bacterium]
MLGDFDIQIATRFVFGHGAERRVGEEAAALGARMVLVHYDGGDYVEASGLLATMLRALDENGVGHTELGGVMPNPRLTLVREGIELCHSKGVDAIVAIGGGSAIDSAKAIGLGAAAETDVWDFFTGEAEPVSTLPVIAICTCPASGSESSQVVVVNNEKEHAKLLVSHPVVRPAVAIMDPELSVTLPPRQTACGLADMFCHVCERYFTDDADFGVLDAMSESVLRTIVNAGPKLMADPANYGLRSEIMWVATIAQNNSLGMGRNQDWATHALSNELSALYDTPHGMTISAILPSWMRYVCDANPRRFARYAREVFGIRDEAMDLNALAHAGVDATEALFRSLGMPVSMADLGIGSDGIEAMLDAIDFFGDDRAIGSVCRLTREDCARIFHMTAERTGI